MGCDRPYTAVLSRFRDFNPRTRMGCDQPALPGGRQPSISIHAPAWGATVYIDDVWGVWDDFNPRTRMGCDLWCWTARICRSYFNPRTRMGCDASRSNPWPIIRLFQSTHPHGVRRDCAATHPLGQKFQSTHPHGVRRLRRNLCPPARAISIHAPAWGATSCCLRRTPTTSHFNPRTRMGCDRARSRQTQRSPYFNPRTRMGCDE